MARGLILLGGAAALLLAAQPAAAQESARQAGLRYLTWPGRPPVQQTRPQPCPQPEGGVRAGHPRGGQGGQDKAAGHVDAQGGPGKRSGKLREGQPQAIAKFRPHQAAGSNGQPGSSPGCP